MTSNILSRPLVLQPLSFQDSTLKLWPGFVERGLNVNCLTLALTLTLSPEEREQHLVVSGFSDAHSANPALGFAKSRRSILPLLGERAGERVGVPTLFAFQILKRAGPESSVTTRRVMVHFENARRDFPRRGEGREGTKAWPSFASFAPSRDIFTSSPTARAAPVMWQASIRRMNLELRNSGKDFLN